MSRYRLAPTGEVFMDGRHAYLLHRVDEVGALGSKLVLTGEQADHLYRQLEAGRAALAADSLSEYERGRDAQRAATVAYCETSVAIIGDNPDPLAVGLAKGYQDVAEKSAPRTARVCPGCGHAPHAAGLCEHDAHPACDCNEDDGGTHV